MDIDTLKKEWIELCSKYIDDNRIINRLYKDILKEYSSRKRYYHTINHINDMLELISSFKHLIENYNEFLFAVWYHDIIYKPFNKNNEEKSALYASKVLRRLQLKEESIKKVYELIMCTKHQSNKGIEMNNDCRFMIDTDLSILGVDRDTYINYFHCIRKEYKRVPDYMYNKGRREILKHFLDLDYIYQTEEFRNMYEKNARSNIMYELESLL